jgi:CheY-like chemotaxis protein
MNDNFTIFYTDDDQDDVEYFTEAIRLLDKDLTLVTYDRGDSLLYALKNPPPKANIIFLDLNMPGKNGFQVLKEIRSTESLKDIPVIIYSTSSDENSIFVSKELGADLFITKPNTFPELKKSIQDALAIDWNRKPELESFYYRTH